MGFRFILACIILIHIVGCGDQKAKDGKVTSTGSISGTYYYYDVDSLGNRYYRYYDFDEPTFFVYSFWIKKDQTTGYYESKIYNYIGRGELIFSWDANHTKASATHHYCKGIQPCKATCSSSQCEAWSTSTFTVEPVGNDAKLVMNGKEYYLYNRRYKVDPSGFEGGPDGSSGLLDIEDFDPNTPAGSLVPSY